MGVRCSLLGCEYEETHIERDREERGDEVILTVREYKECTRCGGVELISENTGVTAVADADADRSDVDEEADTAEVTAGGGDGGAPGPDPTDESPAGETPGPDVERLAAAAQATDAPGEATTAEPSASAPADDGPTVGASTESAGATDPAETSEPEPDVRDDAVVVDGSGEGFESGLGDGTDDGSETATVDGSTAEESTTGEATVEDPADAIRRVGTDDDPEDDAVILTDSGSEPTETGAPGVGVDDADGIGGYDVGESGWPDHDDHGRQEAGATGADASRDAGVGAGGDWPTHDDHGRRDIGNPGTDAGAGGDPPGSGGDPSGSRGGAAVAQATPEATAEARGRGADHDGGRGAGADATRSDAGRTADAEADGTTAGPQLRCPGCGHSVGRGTPHRAGDICPSCSRAYLDER